MKLLFIFNIILEIDIRIFSTILFFTLFPNFYAFAEYQSCERIRIDNSEFSTLSKAETWYPKNITINTNYNKKLANFSGKTTDLVIRADKKRMTAIFEIPSSSGKQMFMKFYFLPNGEVHTTLMTPGGFKELGGKKINVGIAVYKCSNWHKNKVVNTSRVDTNSNSDKEIEKEKKFAKRLELAEKKLEEENKKRIAKEKEEKKKRAEEDKRNKAKLLASVEKKLEEKRKKRIAEEKARRKKEEAERARKKKLVEQERKRKLEQEKIAKKIKYYKREAINFYKDIEEFVKSGGKIDLVKLSKLFNVRPDPKKNWNSPDLKTYENLRQFMSSVSEFVSYEKQMIGERLKKSFALKDQSIAQLEKNLNDLKGLMRKMFGSSDVPQITKMISDIEASLDNFNQSKVNKLIIQTTNYISSKLDKPKVVEKNKQTKVFKKASADQSWLEFQSKLTPQQEQFCKLTESFYRDLNKARKAKNEIMVNRVHKKRQINLDGLIPNGKISNWIFRILKVDQVEDGSAAVVLSLQCKSYVGSGQIHTKSTWRKKSNKEWRATVPYNSRRFNELAKLAAGEFVLASGTLLEVNAFKPGQIETYYASQQIGEHPLTKDLNLEGELFLANLSYIAALN